MYHAFFHWNKTDGQGLITFRLYVWGSNYVDLIKYLNGIVNFAGVGINWIIAQ